MTASTAKCGDGFSSWFTRQRAVECGRNEQKDRKKRNDRAPLQIAIEHLIYSPRELRWFFSGCQDCPSGIVRADQWISKRQPPPNPRTKYNTKNRKKPSSFFSLFLSLYHFWLNLIHLNSEVKIKWMIQSHLDQMKDWTTPKIKVNPFSHQKTPFFGSLFPFYGSCNFLKPHGKKQSTNRIE